MIERIRSGFSKLAQRIDELTLRERVLLFAAALGVLLFVAVNWAFVPLNETRKALETQLATQLKETSALQAQLEGVAQESGKDPNAVHRARIAELRQRLEKIDAAVGVRTKGLVSPKEMARLVERVLLENSTLEIVRVESLASEPLLGAGEGGKPDAGGKSVGLYKHGMRIEVKGRYADVAEYLRALEALPWKVFWGEVTLVVETYPISRVTVVFYTLSRQQAWIGM